MKGLHMVTWILVIIGGLNWGLTAFNHGIQNWLPASVSMVIFILVGLSAIYEICVHKSMCKCCETKGMKDGAAKNTGNTMGAPKM